MMNLYSIIYDYWYPFFFFGVIFLCNSSNANGQGSFESPFTLAITFDQWPEESSWDIRLGDTTIVYSADYQSLSDDSDNTTLIINNLHLAPANHYFFNFYDAFIDGICCIQGNGSYVLSDVNGVIVINGGEFEIKETVIFNVVGDLCSNGLKDNGEEGVDCGGLNCGPCNLPPCVQEVYFTSQDVSNNTSITGYQSIQSKHKIHSNLNVEFMAGQEILLEPGFEVNSGSNFHALINNCL